MVSYSQLMIITLIKRSSFALRDWFVIHHICLHSVIKRRKQLTSPDHCKKYFNRTKNKCVITDLNDLATRMLARSS